MRKIEWRLAVLLMAPVLACAQEKPGGAPPAQQMLSLAEAIALKNNPQVSVSRLKTMMRGNLCGNNGRLSCRMRTLI